MRTLSSNAPIALISPSISPVIPALIDQAAGRSFSSAPPRMQVPPRTPKDRAAVAQWTHHPANPALKRRAAPSTHALRSSPYRNSGVFAGHQFLIAGFETSPSYSTSQSEIFTTNRSKKIQSANLDFRQKQFQLDQTKAPQPRSTYRGIYSSKNEGKKWFLCLPRASRLLARLQRLQPTCGVSCSLRLTKRQ